MLRVNNGLIGRYDMTSHGHPAASCPFLRLVPYRGADQHVNQVVLIDLSAGQKMTLMDWKSIRSESDAFD